MIWVYYIVIYIVTLCTIPNIPSLCSLVLLHFIITCHVLILSSFYTLADD